MTTSPAPTDGTPTGLSRLTPRVLLGFFGTSVMAFMAANLVPVLIAGMVEHLGIDVAGAGMIATAMSLASVLAMLIMNPIVVTRDRASISRIGLALISVGYFLAAFFLTTPLVTAGLIIGGFGIGIVLACGTAAQSSTVNPDRTVASVTVINRLGATTLLAIAPLFQGDLRAVLITIGCLGILGIALAGGLPNLPKSELVKEHAAGDRIRTVTTVGIVLAISMGFWSLTEDMVYSMTSVLAAQAAVPTEIAGLLLSGKVLGGLLGAVIAPLALRTLGRSASLIIIVVVSTIAKFMMITATDPITYAIAISVWGVMYGAVLVLVWGLAATMDVTGKTGVVVLSVYLTGVALGPLVGGQLVGAVSPLAYAFIVTVPSIIFGTTLFLIARSRRKLEEGNTTAVALPDEPAAVDAR